MKEPKKPTTRKKPAAAPAGIADAPTARSRKKGIHVPDAPARSGADREHRIQEAAYLLAEKDGFKGSPEFYWAQAEQQIDAC